MEKTVTEITGSARAPVIVAYGRTAICKAKKGSFRNENPIEFAGQCLAGVIKRVPGLKPEQIEEVVAGCAFPEHLQNYNIARQITFRAGLPDSTSSLTVSRICSSGLQAISTAANSIRAGERDVVAAGGVESMTKTIMYPNEEDKYDYFLRTRPEVYDPPAITAEKVAIECNVTREYMDFFSKTSHEMAVKAQDAGWFEDQIIPVSAHDDEGNEILVTMDEGMRRNVSMEALGTLEARFMENGRVTAGNASQVADGAGFVILMSAQKADELGIEPICEFMGYTVEGLAPDRMGLGPVYAVPRLLKRLQLSIEDIDVMEINEAFAAQALPCVEKLGISWEKVNPMGGAIAYGHPLGGTGGILTCKAISYLKRTGGTYGLMTMCVGGGMGAAGVIKMLQNNE